MKYVVAAALAALALAAPAGATGFSFTPPSQLPHGDPDAAGFIARRRAVAGLRPQRRRPRLRDGAAGDPDGGRRRAGTGDARRASASGPRDDGGATLARAGDHRRRQRRRRHGRRGPRRPQVLAADLEAAATDICTSHDFGKSFPDCDGGIATNQQGPENDREWLTRGTKPGEVYLTYHDFAGGLPIIEKLHRRRPDASRRAARSSTRPGRRRRPTRRRAARSSPSPWSTPTARSTSSSPRPTQTASPGRRGAQPPLHGRRRGRLRRPRRSSRTTSIYENPGADLGKIFQAEAHRRRRRTSTSWPPARRRPARRPRTCGCSPRTDGGKTWSAPVQVNPPNLKANVLPGVAGGRGGGELVVGWFGSATSGDPNDATNQWRYYAATSFDGGQTFAYYDGHARPDPLRRHLHAGRLLRPDPRPAGQPQPGRLRSAATTRRTAARAIALPGDPYNRPDLEDGNDTGGSSAYFARLDYRSARFLAKNAGQPAGTITGGGSGTSGANGRPASTGARRPSGSGASAATRAGISGCAARPATRVAGRAAAGASRSSRSPTRDRSASAAGS